MSFFGLIRRAVTQFFEDGAMEHGAALAFYAALSFGPLLIVLMMVSGFFFQRQIVTGELNHWLEMLVGAELSGMVETFEQNMEQTTGRTLFSALNVGVLLLSITGLFSQLQTSMNQIWNVSSDESSGWGDWIQQRIVGLFIVGVLEFCLVVTILTGVFLNIVIRSLPVTFPVPGPLLVILHSLFSLGFFVLLFAGIFRWMPDAAVPWSSVLVGAVFTAVLFSLGKELMGLYFSYGNVTSFYGPAGSLVVLQLWVYYSALILFFGAEFTQVFSRRAGNNPVTA